MRCENYKLFSPAPLIQYSGFKVLFKFFNSHPSPSPCFHYDCNTYFMYFTYNVILLKESKTSPHVLFLLYVDYSNVLNYIHDADYRALIMFNAGSFSWSMRFMETPLHLDLSKICYHFFYQRVSVNVVY